MGELPELAKKHNLKDPILHAYLIYGMIAKLCRWMSSFQNPEAWQSLRCRKSLSSRKPCDHAALVCNMSVHSSLFRWMKTFGDCQQDKFGEMAGRGSLTGERHANRVSKSSPCVGRNGFESRNSRIHHIGDPQRYPRTAATQVLYEPASAALHPGDFQPLKHLLTCILLGSLLIGCRVFARVEEATPSPSATEQATRLSVERPPTGQTPEQTTTPLFLSREVCPENAGQVLEGTYPAKAVSGEIRYLIYLPPCYAAINQRYPTFYLLHGFPYDETQWLDLGLKDWLDRRITTGDFAPFLVVMPRQPEPLFRSSDGGPGSYEDEFINNLVPFIDKVYPTQAERKARAVGGLSRGGVWALEIGLRHPESVSMVAAISPALAVNYPRDPYNPFLLIQSVSSSPDQFLLVAGDQDWALSETVRLSELMKEFGLESELHIVPGGHDPSTWQAALEWVLDWWTRAQSQEQ